jgi:co-chaperonin GroES (HSP10)
VIYNPATIRPKKDFVTVLAEPREVRLDSGIFLPQQETGAEKVTEGAGRVMRVGPGKKAEAVDLKEGDRVLYRGFLKYANPIETDETWPDGTPKQYFLMAVDDILSVIPDEVKVGIYSGRPQVPERSKK